MGTRIWPCVTLKLVITGCTETLSVYVPMGGGGAPALLTQLAISSVFYQELSFFCQGEQRKLCGWHFILIVWSFDLPWCSASEQISASLALCSQQETHQGQFQPQFFENSGSFLASKRGKKRADIPRCTSSFKKQPLCARTWCCIIIYPLKWQRAASPPYTSSMQTMPSPAFSRWVIVTVAASPEARARPANSEEQENAAVGKHQAPVEHTAIISVVTLTILCTIQSSHSFLQTVPRRVATAAVFKALKNHIKY